MIPIKLSQIKKEELKKWYIDLIESKVIKRNVASYYNEVESELSSYGIHNKMQDILVMEHHELKDIYNTLTTKGQVFKQYNVPTKRGKVLRVRGEKYIVDNKILKKTYDLYSDIPNSELVKKIGITVCPYCNREFINNRDKKTSAQLDHFFPRSKYPIFSISLFNLVPSCYACNHIKREKLLDISPYENNLKSDSYYEFSYLLKGVDFLKNREEIKIIIRPLMENKNNSSILQLEDAYEIHNDVVQEILKKKMIYSNGQIVEFLNNFKGLFHSTEEINRILYGNYLNEDDLGSRPLAKLTSDIVKNSKTNKKICI